MNNIKDIQTVYHTNLRNVGLFTSVSLALMGSSRFFRGKDMQFRNIGYLTLSIICIVISILLASYLLEDHKIYMNKIKNEEKNLLNKWYIIPNILLITNIILLFIALYTMYLQF
tara:strand:- start:63 stop:404 length:342 start_codon:yes stop_codon:yes gene_type:complete